MDHDKEQLQGKLKKVAQKGIGTVLSFPTWKERRGGWGEQKNDSTSSFLGSNYKITVFTTNRADFYNPLQPLLF